MTGTSIFEIDLLSSDFTIKHVEELDSNTGHYIASAQCSFSSDQIISGPAEFKFDTANIVLTSESTIEHHSASIIDVPKSQQGFFTTPAHTRLDVTLKSSQELLKRLFERGMDSKLEGTLMLTFSLNANYECNFIKLVAETFVSSVVDDDLDDDSADTDSESIFEIQNELNALSEKMEEFDRSRNRIDEIETAILGVHSDRKEAARKALINFRFLKLGMLATLVLSILAISQG